MTSIEGAAKAALLQHLKERKTLSARTSLAVELGLARQANRADVAVIDGSLHVFEIKSKRDNLGRLSKQLACYEAVADFVTVVVATKHLNTVLSSLDAKIGIMEITDFGDEVRVIVVRPAIHLGKWRSDAALDLLPAGIIRSRLLKGIGPTRRADLLSVARQIADDQIRKVVLQFLRDRYRQSTKEFLRACARRRIEERDLKLLNIWPKGRVVCSDPLANTSPEKHEEYLLHVGKSFGPVPDEISKMIKR